MLVKDLDDLLQRRLGAPASPFRKLFTHLLRPVHFFEGQTRETVVVLSGLHGSEASGIEIANWLRVKLESSKSAPYYQTLVIPEMFAKEAEIGRNSNGIAAKPGAESNKGRDVEREKQRRFPNREFPPPGMNLDVLLTAGDFDKGYFALDNQVPAQRFKTCWKENKKVQHGDSRLLSEVIALALVIQAVRPARIISIHGKRLKENGEPFHRLLKGGTKDADVEEAFVGLNYPGIFVDPRYSYSAERAARERDLDPQKFVLAQEPSYPKERGEKKTLSASDQKLGAADDDLCLQIAQDVARRGAAIPTTKPAGSVDWSVYSKHLTVGNHLHLAVPTVHYAFESGDCPDFQGFSLGDWGPVGVEKDATGYIGIGGKRGAAPVYTIETFGYAESGGFRRDRDDFTPLVDQAGAPLKKDDAPKKYDSVRCLQLQAYAEALQAVALEAYKPSAKTPPANAADPKPPDAGSP